MSTRFFTNTGDNTLLKKFAGIFEHNADIERFDALIGYLRSSGYFGQVVDHQVGPNEAKALRFLAIFINHPTLAREEEKFLLRAA